MNASQVAQLKVAELKEELKRRGLPLKGLKAELVDRLLGAIQAEGRQDEPDASQGGEPKTPEHDNSEIQQPPEIQQVDEERKAEKVGKIAPEPKMEPHEAANQEVEAEEKKELQPVETTPGNVVDPAPVATSNEGPPSAREETEGGHKEDVISTGLKGAEEGVVSGKIEVVKADLELVANEKGLEHDVEMAEAPEKMEVDAHKDADNKVVFKESTIDRSQEAAEAPKEVIGAKQETGLKRVKEEDVGSQKEEGSEERPSKLQKVEERPSKEQDADTSRLSEEKSADVSKLLEKGGADVSKSLEEGSADVSRPFNEAAADVNRLSEAKGADLNRSSEKQAADVSQHAENKSADVSRPSDRKKEPQKGSVTQAGPEAKTRPAEKAPARPAFGRSAALSNGDKKREVPASARPPTRSVRVNNLVRPFTEKALRALLSETGTIEDTGFWMDSIKTHCYVTFKSVDEAVRTREALFNLQWPPMGGRHLAVSFVPESEVQGKVKGTATANNGKAKDESAVPKRTMVEERQKTVLPVKDRLNVPSAEKAPAAVQEPPVLSLDDLFRKTTAKPPLYWLPLTDAQVQQRQQEREKALATKGKAA